MAAEEFSKLWEFDDGEEVCIKHSRKGKKWLRIEPKDDDDIDWDGQKGGGRAVWKAHYDPETNIVQFESTKTGKFLNVEKDGKGWRCSGKKDGKLARFILEKYGKGSAILRLEKEYDDGEKRYIGSKNGDPRPVKIFTKGELQEYSKPFDKDSSTEKKIIIQRSRDCNQLRIKKDDVIVNKEGGTGEAAQWKIIKDDDEGYAFKSVKDKDAYLRIKKDGKEVDCQGKKGGNLTYFEIEEIFDELGQHVQIKSKKTNTYLGVGDGGKVKGFEEPDGQRTRFTLFATNDEE